jgi:hypothetical protein
MVLGCAVSQKVFFYIFIKKKDIIFKVLTGDGEGTRSSRCFGGIYCHHLQVSEYDDQRYKTTEISFGSCWSVNDLTVRRIISWNIMYQVQSLYNVE